MSHDELETVVGDYLTLRGYLVVRTHGPRNKPVQPGVPDLIAMQNGRALLVEVKAGRDRQRADQMDFEERARRRGVPYVVVRSLEDVEGVA